ncbi:hypothetical protein QQF64_002158 [Cirrhinus molitorella]|uniref:Uncharacterized protein n=1 Tax=Cirrhinus molitorella TaxID=172907 RepID=A0ABR3MPE0_9TELE
MTRQGCRKQLTSACLTHVCRERVLAESRQKWWRVALTPLHSSSSQSEQLGLRSRSPARTGYCTDDIYVSAAPEGPT